MKVMIGQLPDINDYRQLPQHYDDYGRFGITNNGNFYVYGIKSSHDNNTKTGGYWACNKAHDILMLSPRGTSIGFEDFVKEIIARGYVDNIRRLAGLKR